MSMTVDRISPTLRAGAPCRVSPTAPSNTTTGCPERKIRELLGFAWDSTCINPLPMLSGLGIEPICPHAANATATTTPIENPDFPDVIFLYPLKSNWESCPFFPALGDFDETELRLHATHRL